MQYNDFSSCYVQVVKSYRQMRKNLATIHQFFWLIIFMQSKKHRCAVVCTSTSSLDDFGGKPKDISVLRLNIHTPPDNDYLDGQNLRAQNFYRWMQNNPKLLPSTSPPDGDSIIETFDNLVKLGYTDVIVPTISSTLSNTYQDVCDIARLMKKKIAIHVIDTGTVGIMEGLFSLKAHQLLNEGYLPHEVVFRLTMMARQVHIFFVLDSTNYLVKNGRISALKGALSSVFNIKPILHFHRGVLQQVGKISNIENAIEHLMKLAQNTQSDMRAQLIGLYSGDEALYKKLEEQVEVHYGLKIPAYPITPVVGAHVGPRVIGLGLWMHNNVDINVYF